MEPPRIGIILGSGLGNSASILLASGEITIPYSQIPGMPCPGIAGHDGRLVVGRLSQSNRDAARDNAFTNSSSRYLPASRDSAAPTEPGNAVMAGQTAADRVAKESAVDGEIMAEQGRTATTVALMLGRVHGYEGHPDRSLVSGAAFLVGLGVTQLVLTNAAGGIRPDLQPGTLMLIRDHITFPVRGFSGTRNKSANASIVRADSGQADFDSVNTSSGTRRTGSVIVDSRDRRYESRQPWCGEMLSAAESVVTSLSVTSGVYAMMPGPCYETPAEIRMLRLLGADAVGMSTVPEAVYAASADIPVLGISCITNVAAGLSDQRLNHQEVTDTAERTGSLFSTYLRDLLNILC